jgi:hypothetical protein
MDARSLVLRVGDEISGWGRLVRASDGDWFDPPLAVPAIGYGPEGRPPPRPSSYGLPVEGADFDAVESRYERDAAIDGFAKIYGVWLADRISIQGQSTEHVETVFPRWSDPPCEPPAAGWPHGRHNDNMDVDLGELEATGAAVTTVIFRPSDDQTVLVVAATDIAAVEARLRPQLPDRLCVVASRCTRAQLDQAEEHLLAMWDQWGIYQSGAQCDEQAQATMTATLVRVTDEIADWIDTQPDGLIALEPCLIPRRAGY